jgi:probable F420-dependent oxidoreductase
MAPRTSTLFLFRPTCQDRRMIDIGAVGLWTALLDQHPTGRVREVVAELESLGWPCVWRPEATGRDALVSAAIMLEASSTLRIATGIAQIYARHPLTARAAQKTLHEAYGGRFLLGLGVSHAPMIEQARKLPYVTPYSDMVDYLAAMAEAPFTAYAAPDEPTTVIAALGPKMLRLAATAADGAHPYFSPVEHTAEAREILGEGKLLAPEQMVVINPDRALAHALAAEHMTRYLRLPNYANNLLRHGFDEADLAGPSPRLIDAIVVCGEIDAVVRRVADQHAAGADHVCLQVLTPPGAELPMREWTELADAFALRPPPAV